jgi:hypothetical protein
MNYVLDGLRTEFPSFFAALARVRVPAIRRESPFWAFLSALGAAAIVSGVLRMLLLAAPRPITEPSLQLPLGATLASIVTLVAYVVAGAVLTRAGGRRAVFIYVAFALIEALSQLTGILIGCDRTRNQLGFQDGACNVPLFYVAAGRAPEWLGVALGIAIARVVPSSGPGANQVLRGGGVFALTLFLLFAPASLVFNAITDQALRVALYILEYSVAGVAAGIVLREARFAGALLVALAVVGPTLGLALPLVRGGGPSGEPIEITFTRFGGLLAPALAALCLLGAWILARRRLR